MSKRTDDLIVNVIAILIIATIIAIPVTLKLWSVKWDIRCLVTECRIVK